MIVGIGNDLTDIRRIDDVLKRHGKRFEERVFTETERAVARRRSVQAPTYAKRFAAKEACAKALGTGLGAGVRFRDIGVVNLPSGQPTLVLEGRALARAQSLIPDGHVLKLHISLTDDYPWAQAFVIIEAVKAE